MSLNEYANYIFYNKYMVEAQGISYELKDVSLSIYNLIKNKLTKQNIEKLIYTGYNWNFNKKEFIKLDDEYKEYPLYIKICQLDNGVGKVGRKLSQEKYNTDIIINISIDINPKYLQLVIRHELQHCKELYILKDRNVLLSDKTTIYNSPKLNSNFKEQNKDLFYPLSKTEQRAILQEIYSYVYDNKNITRNNLLDNEIGNISKVNKFYWLYRYYLNFIGLNIYYYDLNILNIGYVLKQNFNYKNSNFTNTYIDNANSYKLEKIDISILMDIMQYLENLIQKYQRKILRIIYLAIEDRDN